jgi:MFS family permease
MSGGGDKTQVAGDQGEEIDIPLGVQLAVYATGTFGNTVNNVVTVILPLWAIHLNASPLMIGLILGARHLLTMVFSIHGGALMDRLGTRRVLVWFAAIGALTPFLFPIMPWLWAVVVLQMLGGISSSFAWMGAQALVGQIMRGSPLYAGRLSFVLRIGHLAAPLAAGISWDLFGPWGGFTVLGLWGLGVLLASLALPKPEVSESRTKLGADDLMPRLSDYTGALRMMAVPAIALVVMASTLRMSGQGMHGSFYVVYLEGIHLSGTLIGVLLAVGSLIGFAGALSVAPLARRFSGHWLLIGAVAGGVLCIAVTPLLGGIFLALLLVAGIRGGTMALAQPLMISILSGAAGRDQGKGVGMRTTANRLVSFAVPVIMGGVVELVGLENSFYVVGGVLIALCLAIAVYAERTPELGRAPDG